jgi:hypothetical protein
MKMIECPVWNLPQHRIMRHHQSSKGSFLKFSSRAGFYDCRILQDTEFSQALPAGAADQSRLLT